MYKVNITSFTIPTSKLEYKPRLLYVMSRPILIQVQVSTVLYLGLISYRHNTTIQFRTVILPQLGLRSTVHWSQQTAADILKFVFKNLAIYTKGTLLSQGWPRSTRRVNGLNNLLQQNVKDSGPAAKGEDYRNGQILQ